VYQRDEEIGEELMKTGNEEGTTEDVVKWKQKRWYRHMDLLNVLGSRAQYFRLMRNEPPSLKERLQSCRVQRSNKDVNAKKLIYANKCIFSKEGSHS
jgi:hypothetical protein